MSIIKYMELTAPQYQEVLTHGTGKHYELPEFDVCERLKQPARLIDLPTNIVWGNIGSNHSAAIMNQWVVVGQRYYKYRNTII